MPAKAYVGDELEIFAKATNWKKYYFSFMKPYLKGNVLEVGAGIGSATAMLCEGMQRSWTCLEPDAGQAGKIKDMIKKSQIQNCRTMIGTIEDLGKRTVFDAIIYIDVIEHIENDSGELEKAASHLAQGGFLIIGVPANQWLYTKFDKAIGHYRRYNKGMLKAVIPQNLRQEKLVYLDSAGLLASFSNKLLRQDYPTEKQVLFWSNVIVRVSKFSDKIFMHSFGKQMVGIWKKT